MHEHIFKSSADLTLERLYEIQKPRMVSLVETVDLRVNYHHLPFLGSLTKFIYLDLVDKHRFEILKLFCSAFCEVVLIFLHKIK